MVAGMAEGGTSNGPAQEPLDLIAGRINQAVATWSCHPAMLVPTVAVVMETLVLLMDLVVVADQIGKVQPLMLQ